MSKNYDNWERLVAAVLRREELKRIALSSSLESSTNNSESSSISSPTYDQSPQLPNFEALNNLSLERFLRVDKWEVKAKHSSAEALQRWRDLCGVEKLRVAVLISKAALQYIQGMQSSDYTVPKVQASGFQICGDELGSIVEGHDVEKLKFQGGTSGISEKLPTCPSIGLSVDNEALNRRQEISGINKFQESEARSFWVFVWKPFKICVTGQNVTEGEEAPPLLVYRQRKKSGGGGVDVAAGEADVG
ncbi:hypothetical protein BUALT_Bualt11G0068000 [Buddleja alternifolia]|uniref:Cation-transporting P-type ATPase N-terminal domain-containing protein n=1 Tax=Buddleja alternifolia TaxID=168488 RepID=A0AAV6X148_9LAMI|nr:hypothetical protein BUALT_Bualt11G0068000 [Buddleja alternifolia]